MWNQLGLCVAAMCASAHPSIADIPSHIGNTAAFVNTSEPAATIADEIIVDLPSARSWSRFQFGRLGNWAYVIYPDGYSRILRGESRLTLAAIIDCRQRQSCHVQPIGASDFTVPAGRGERPKLPEELDLQNVAKYLSRWILFGTFPSSDSVAPTRSIAVASPTPTPQSKAATLQLTAPVSRPPAESQRPMGDSTFDRHTTPGGERSANTFCTELSAFNPNNCFQTAEPAAAFRILQYGAPLAASGPVASNSVGHPAPKETRWRAFLRDYSLSCAITASASLVALHPDTNTRGSAKPRFSLGCSARVTEKLTVRGALVAYPIGSSKKDWDPDFTYAFTYRATDRINLTYSNYSASFSDGGLASGLFNGKLRASLQFPAIPLPADRSMACNGSIQLPDPTEASLNLSCGFAVTEKLRLSATVQLYADGAQESYQPDYTYTASYRITDGWLLSYSNYSNNRWPWNRGTSTGVCFIGRKIS